MSGLLARLFGFLVPQSGGDDTNVPDSGPSDTDETEFEDQLDRNTQADEAGSAPIV